MFKLTHKKAIITGAGSGIGKAVALVFGAQGAHVHVVDINETEAKGTAEEIQAAGGSAEIHLLNITDHDLVNAVFASIGAADILVNCAGIAHIGKADTTPAADFSRVFDVNVKGVYNCIHAMIPLLRKQGGGVIINISSIAAHVGLSDRFAYSMSKGAVHAMTLSVAKDYISENIRCNSISPARVHTPFVDGFLAANYPGREAEMFQKLSHTQPLGRMGKPTEIANLALYLCAEESSFITGSDYKIDGGFITLNT
jgi:NAD(P)-dependent dehydrogenase (short-subunit alcohol dehydrogenase family)